MEQNKLHVSASQKKNGQCLFTTVQPAILLSQYKKKQLIFFFRHFSSALCRVWPLQEPGPLWSQSVWVCRVGAAGGSDWPEPSESRHHQEQTHRELPGGPKWPLGRSNIVQWRLQMDLRVKWTIHFRSLPDLTGVSRTFCRNKIVTVRRWTNKKKKIFRIFFSWGFLVSSWLDGFLPSARTKGKKQGVQILLPGN